MELKKGSIILLILVTKSLLLSAQPGEVRFLIDTTISIMKQNGVNANRVDWDTLKRNALMQSADITNPYELGDVMRYLFRSIDDFHGAFFYKDSTFQWHHNEPLLSDSITNEWKKGNQIKTLILQNNIGYLRIPSMPAGTISEFNSKAQSLQDSFCSLLNKKITGVILDLRLNGGGAMFPMILGVKQLLPEGIIGSFQIKKKEDWMIKDNRFYVDTALLATIHPMCNANAQNLPVVILTSPATGSSAECFIISFKGRKNTVLLGSKTAGYVTVNSGFPIDDMAFINLSVGYSADRFGNVYKQAISPDIPFESIDKFNDIANDEKVKAASQWLIAHRTQKK